MQKVFLPTFLIIVTLLSLSAAAYVSEVPAIIYHSVCEAPQGDFSITPETFENDIKYLKNNGYETVTLDEIYDSVYNGTELAKKPVLLTFDDGYRDVLYEVTPILEKYEYNAVMAVTGSSIGKKLSYFPHMNAEELKMMDSSRMFELVSHSYNLHSTDERVGCMRLSGESLEKYKKLLKEDLDKSFSGIHDITGDEVCSFAYPYGEVSDESIDVLENIGVKTALLSEVIPNKAIDSKVVFVQRVCRLSSFTTDEFFNYFDKVYDK